MSMTIIGPVGGAASGTIAPSGGGTGLTTATPHSPVFSGTTATGTWNASLGPGTAGFVLISNGPGAYPSWAAVSGVGTVTSVDVSGGTTGLTTSGGPVTGAGTITFAGTLVVANGGTGLTAGTSGGVLAFTASGTLASSGALTASAIVLGGGAGAVPTVLGSLGTTTTVLHGNAAGAPTFGAVSLTADVSGILPGANGGTANGFFAVSGPAASLKTYTLPNASAAILTDNAAVTVPQGGSGIATTTAYSLVMSGTTATGAWAATIGPGTAAQVLTSNGAGAYPTWQAAAGGISGLTTGRVPYAASSTTLADSTAFVASVANDSVAHWTLTSLFAGKPGMVIKGAASQAADLQQWQNSSSTVLANITSAGTFGFSPGTTSNATFGLQYGGAYTNYGLNWVTGYGFASLLGGTYYALLSDQTAGNLGNTKLGSGVQLNWSSASSPVVADDKDTGLKRLAAGLVGATNGSSSAGSFGASSYYLGTATSAIKWTSGSGSPESAVTAPVGSLYSRTDGGAATSLYVKESGTGNTGWTAK